MMRRCDDGDFELIWAINDGLSGHPKPANEGHLKTGQRVGSWTNEDLLRLVLWSYWQDDMRWILRRVTNNIASNVERLFSEVAESINQFSLAGLPCQARRPRSPVTSLASPYETSRVNIVVTVAIGYLCSANSSGIVT
jgi:hypothetical protein